MTGPSGTARSPNFTSGWYATTPPRNQSPQPGVETILEASMPPVHDSATATEGEGPFGGESFGIGPFYPTPVVAKRGLTDRPVSQAGNVTR